MLEECNEVVKRQSGVLFGKREDTKWKDGGEWKWFENDDDDRTGRYKGEIVNGKPNGQGTFINIEGHKYVGEWKDGLPNGQGTYTFSDGRKYVGEFKDGLPNGKGTQTYSNGRKYVGEFKDGNRWNGTSYNKNGNIRDNYVNGVIQ